MSTLGRNIAFPIYNGDGTSFHNLVIKKSTSDSIVMSLGDKVTGDVYYKDNTLECNMDEYILVDGVKYSIVNPPTIVREGLKSENGDLKGMTKYSFEFYHPMYMLGNMAFSDVAVTDAESMFKSHDRTFSWIGNLTDYVAKLNKNLQNTQFVVSISSSIDTDSRKVLSDVLSFTNNTIADALKTAYDTWHFPFVVDAIKSGEQYYNQGKRFLIQFGNPTREILDSNNQPFVFHFGKGVGLKNNSRTPRNNKIVTRVAGYGSEQNIPYGYPQIPWTGDPSATQTADGYPIYEGIVGGVVTKLVKHPFTRTHLMPSVYAESVRKKVDSAAADYDNTTPLVDYYDAPSTYPNPINLAAPKLDIVGIETIKPELGDMAILGVTPLNNDLTPASGWDDTMDDDGNYTQSYFKITLPQLDFDIYACASITEEMKINMRSGACIGCTFDAQVDWDDYKKNFFDAQGNFLPNGAQRDLTKYPKSNDGSIDLIVKKDLNTYGTLMPNVYQKPSQGDKFVILGISMPSTYITNAEERLDAALMTHMLDNNVYYYDYPLKFDEDFFYNHTDILSQVRPNSVLRFTFGGVKKSLYIKQITIKYGEGVLPKYDITLTDNIEVVLNQIGLVADDVSRLAMAMMQMNKRTNINITNTESLQKYVDYTIMPNLESIQKQIDGSQVTYFGNENPFDASQPYSDGKYVVDPTKFPASEWDDDYSEHDGDMFYNRDSGKGYEFTIIDNSSSPVVYGWQLIQDEDIIQALNNAQNAQDTADGKRRVFICDASHHTPNPPYDVGDLWVNVKYPYATGATYDDEILKCVVAKTEDQAFDISDWSLANGYTAALRNFINGTYAQNLQDIQDQIDGKAETWYQNTDPSTAWTTTALKNQHKGDIWHNSSTSTINGVKAGQDAIWNGTAWVVDETVPQAVYDEIDGKCAIYVTWGAWGNDLQEKDLFIPAANTTQDGITYKANKVYRCVDKDTPTFQEIAYTDDTQYNGFITKLIGSSGQTKDAAENAIAAIKHALSDGNTYNEGGLILSNLISLGTGNPTSGTFTPWAGISGIYKTSETGTGYKGHGIAAWFGGGMIDKEVSAVSNAAKSLFRFDGSGYVASGNLKWDANGNVTIQGYSINATTLQVGGANVATQAMLDNFVSKAFFNRLFTAYDANGNAIVPNNTTTAINNLKIMVGAWTEQYLSALGLNSEGGGGGTGDVSHIKIGTNPDVFLDPDEDGIIDMSSYAANWNDAYNKRHTHSNKSVLDGITSTKVSHWDAVYGVVPSAAYETGNSLADKNFVNSSISTSTATFRGTNTTATTESAFLTWANGLTHDLNDYVFWSTKDSAGNTIYKRYKYDGSQWVFEYDLNNSSFTSDQWSAINSGITSTHVTKLNGIASGAQVNVIESVKVNGSALTVKSKAVDITAVPLTIITGADDLKAIEGLSGTGFLKRTGNNTWALDTTVVLSTRKVSTGNGLQGGGNLANDLTLSIKLDNDSGLSVASTGLKLNIVNDLETSSAYRAISATQAKKIWDLLNQMFTLEGKGTDASPYVIKANYGLYTNQFLSALGQNSQGGGGGDFSEEQMWAALQANTGTYENAKINWNHIPLATTSTAGAIKVGSTLAISNGILNQATIPNLTADVYTKVTVDTYGRVTQGGYLLADDIPSLSWSKITSGKPTTLSGYGITNAYTKAETDSAITTAVGRYLPLTGGTMTGNITMGKNAIVYNMTHDNSWDVAQNSGIKIFNAIGKSAEGAPTEAEGAYSVGLSVKGYYGFQIAAYGGAGNVVWVKAGSGSWVKLLHSGNYSSYLPYLNSGTTHATNSSVIYAPTSAGTANQVLLSSGSGAPSWTNQSSLVAGKATQLQTARTLWGQSFDGTANVNGVINVTGNSNYSEGIRLHHVDNLSSIWFGAVNNNGYDAGMWGITVNSNGMRFRGAASTTGTSPSDYVNIIHGGNVGIGTTSPSYKLDVNGSLGVASGITLTTTKKIKFGTANDAPYIELDSNGYFHFSAGLYSDSFVSALGSNDQGGSSSGFDEEQMWKALNSSYDDNHLEIIDDAHLPNLDASKITSGTFNASRIPTLPISKISGLQTALDSFATQTWVNTQLGNYLPLSGGTLQKSSGDTPLYIKSTNKYGAYIGFKASDDSTFGFIGVRNNNVPAFVYDGNVYDILHAGNYTYFTYSKAQSDANYVTALGVNGNNLTWTKNGNTTNITVPYATSAGTATKLGSATVGSSVRPIYLNNGTPTQVTSLDGKLVGGYIGYSIGGFLVTHPEVGYGIIVPYVYNDLAFLSSQGGSCTIYSTTDTDLTKATLTVKTDWSSTGVIGNIFDASPSYWSPGNDKAIEMNADGLIIDITLPELKSYANKFYIDFGNANWGYNYIDILLKNSNNETDYVTKVSAGEISHNTQYYTQLSHNSTPQGGGSSQSGFNRMRIHLYGRTVAAGVRIAQIGLIRYNSIGHRYTTMSRGYDDYVYRSITPNTTSTYNLGLSSKRWNNIYGTTLNLSGSLSATTGSFSSSVSVGSVLSVSSDTTIGGNLTLSTNNKSIRVTDSNGTARTIINFNSSNTFQLGCTPDVEWNTILRGYRIYFQYGTSNTIGMILNSAGNLAIGVDAPSYRLHVGGTLGVTGAATLLSSLSVASGITLTTTKKIYFGDSSHYLELDANGYFHFSHGLYSDSFVSALGANSQGGGGSTFDEEQMWQALGSDPVSAKKIDNSHLNIAAWAKAANKPSYAWSEITNKPTWIGTSKPTYTFSEITSKPTTLSGYGVLDDANGKYYALYGGTDLNPSSTNAVDLNTITTVGSYYCRADATSQYVSNRPVTNNAAFRVWVSAPSGVSSDYIRQRFQSYNSDVIYERFSHTSGASWWDWVKVQDALYNYAPISYFTNDVAKKAYHIEPMDSVTDSTIYTTVGEAKDRLTNLISNQRVGIGDNITVNTTIIRKWNDDSAATSPSSSYSMIKIGGGYSGSNYGQWLLSSYNLSDVGVVGRTSSTWSAIKWLAWTDGTNASGTWGIGITGNAGSATKLQTPRTIWGQSFDGSANVDGAFKAKKDLGGNLADWVQKQHDGVFEVGRATNKMCVAIGVTDDDWGYIQSKGYGITSSGKLAIQPSGGDVYINSKVGIGTSSPSATLHVVGSFVSSVNASIGGTLSVGGATTLSSSLSVSGNTTTGTIYMRSGATLYLNDESAYKSALQLNQTKDLLVGYGFGGSNGHNTSIYGHNIVLNYGTDGRYEGARLNSSGNFGIGTSSPAYKLDVNGYTSTTRLYLSSNVYLEYDSTNGGVHLVGAGLYSDSYISALGANSQGGGGSTFDEEQMWQALDATNEVINTSHIPDISAVYGYAKQSWVTGQNYATQTWVNTQLGNYLPLSGGTITGNGENPFSIRSNGSTYNYVYYYTTSGLKAATGYFNGLAFVANETTKSKIGVNDSGVPQYWSNNSSSSAKTLLHGGNTYVTNGVGYIEDTEITTITGNAGSATKLQTPRTIWGQSFDGSANVDGAFSGATTGAFSSNVSIGGNISVTGTSSLHSAIYVDNGKIAYWKDSGGTLRRAFDLDNGNNLQLGYGTAAAGYNTYINGNNLYFGYGTSKTAGLTLNSSGNTILSGDLYLGNNKTIWFKDTASNNLRVLRLSENNGLVIGESVAVKGYHTILAGNNIYLRYGTSQTTGLTLDSSGVVSIAGATNIAGLLSANGNVKTTKLYLYKPNADDTNAVYLTYDSTNNGIHVVGAGLYSDSYVSALGANSQSGGGGDASLNAVWGSLTTYNDEYKDEVIDVHHIPNLSWAKITNRPTTLSGYGILDAYTKTQADAKYATISSLSDYATQTWVNQQGFVKSSGVTSVATGSGLTGGTITSTGTISIVSGFSTWNNTIATWGTLTAANGYTNALHWATSDGGDMTFAYKSGKISAQLDGYFYQNEGVYRVVDTSDLAAGKSWGMSITGSAAKLGTSTVGSSVRPIYLNNGTPTVANVETTYLVEPNYVDGTYDGVTYTKMPLFNTVRPNRFVLLPADQIIIEKTTDGGATWVDAGISDSGKKNLFLGNAQNSSIAIPQINGERNKLCGIRITITGMKYNVPEGTPETQKYNYWNVNYVASTERYCSISSLYFWVSAVNDRIRTAVYAATGAEPNNWVRADYADSYLNGWSGGDTIKINNSRRFGGGTNQTTNHWNWRIEFFTDGLNGADLQPTNTSYVQAIHRIQGYGASGWVVPNNLMAIDHIYTWDADQNATFPNSIIPRNNSTQYLGTAANKWLAVYSTSLYLNGGLYGATTGEFSNNVTIGGHLYFGNAKVIFFKNRPASGTAVDMSVIDFTSTNQLLIGHGTATYGYDTYIKGNNVYLTYGSSKTTGLTLNSSGNIVTVGHTYMANGKAIYFKDSGGTVRNSIEFGTNNVFSLGYGAGAAGYDTNLYGNRIYLRYGTSGTVGLTLGSSGAVIIPSTGSLKIGDATLSWDSTNQMLKVDKGFYSEGAVSALGSNDEGGGSSDFSEELMWAALQSNTGTYANEKIDANHIPDTSSLYGYLKSSSLSGYVNAVSTSGSGNAVTSVTKSGNTITFTKGSTFLTSHQTLYTLSIYGGTTKVLDFKPNANASIYIKAGGDISLTNDTTNKYITLSYTHPTNGANTTISAASGKVLSAITVNSLGHVTSVSSKTLAAADIPDISATYATASRATTLEGYFTDGVANNAAKLNGQAASYYATASNVTTLQGYFTSGAANNVVTTADTTNTLYVVGVTSSATTTLKRDTSITVKGNALSVGSITASDTVRVAKNAAEQVFFTAANSTGSVQLLVGATGNRGVYDVTNTTWIIATNGTNTWLYEGNVGIGTTTPSKKLDVNGTLNASGAVTFGSTLGVTGATTLTGLLTANGNIKTGTSNGAYIQIGAIKLVYDSTNNALKVIKSDDSSANFYATGAVSALGANTGGSSTFDEDSMWAALGTTSSAKVIASSHIPNLSASKITSGTFAAARIPSLAASKITSGTFDTARIPNLSWNKITSDKPTTLDGYGITNAFSQTQCFNRFYSLYDGKEIEASSSSAVDLDTITDIGSYYCETNTASGYVTHKPANRDIAFRMWVSAPTGTTAGYRRQRFQFYDQVAVYERIDTNLSSVSWGNWYKVQDNLADYASASSVTTLQGYFTNGVANSATTASKLSTVSKTAWGQTYWTSGGVPTNISGALSDVTNITMSGNIYLNNNQYIYTKDSGGTNRPVFYMTTNDNLYIGYGATAAGGATYVAGTSVELRYGSSRTTGLTLDSSGDVTVKGKVCVGTGGADSYLASDTADNIYLRNSSGAVLVCDGKVIRRSTSVSDVTLGSSTYPWGGVYSTTGTFNSNVSVGGTLDVTGAVTMSSNLTVTGWVRPIGNLVMGTSSNSMNADSGQIHFRTSYMTDFTKHCSPYIQAIGGSSYGRKRLSVFQNNGTSSDYNVAYSEVFTILANGRVGIGNTTPGALLGVSGDILASGEITASSDERKKNIISDTKFNVRDIASARSILYKWNDDRDKDNEKKIHGGSIAQDWLGKADSFLSQDNDGWYSINYGALALCSAITIAREVLKHGSEIDRLKQENERLKARVSELERRVA